MPSRNGPRDGQPQAAAGGLAGAACRARSGRTRACAPRAGCRGAVVHLQQHLACLVAQLAPAPARPRGCSAARCRPGCAPAPTARAASPATSKVGLGVSAGSSRCAVPRAWACGARSASTWRTTSARSSGSRRPAAAPGSLRASVSSCSTRRAARSTPATRASMVCARVASSSVPQCTTWACSFSAVSGERSSCAASATKARWLAMVSSSRANSALSERTIGATSSAGRCRPAAAARPPSRLPTSRATVAAATARWR